MKRYTVRICDNLGTLVDAHRQRTWTVEDRQTGRVVSDHDTRAEARREASTRNAADLDSAQPAEE